MSDDPELEPEDDSPVIRTLRKDAARAGELEAENQRLQRELVFVQSGLNLNDSQRKALAAVHEGDWTPDTIKQTADSLGFIKPAEPEPAPVGVPTDQIAAMERVNAASGGQPPPPPDLVAQINACKTPQELDELLRQNNMLAGTQ